MSAWLHWTFILFVEMAPVLMFGFLIAGILHEFLPEASVQKHLGQEGKHPELKSALLGVPLPLCSCSVIPSAVTLKRLGARDSAVVSFLTATPQTGIDSLIVTYSFLGPIMAAFKPLAAFLMGLCGGLAVRIWGEEIPVTEPAKNSCCSKSTPSMQSPSGLKRLGNILRYAYIENMNTIGSWLFIGILIAGAIGWIIPDHFFEEILHQEFLTMIVMIVVGIPMYICATSSIPIAVALMLKGLSPGSAFVFLTAGPATNAALLSVMLGTIGRRNTVIYLGNIILVGVLAGILLNQIHEVIPIQVMPLPSIHEHGIQTYEWILSLLFAATLIRPLMRDFRALLQKRSDPFKKSTCH